MAQALPMIGKIGQGVTGGLGILGNIIGANRQNTIQKAALAQEKELAALAANPALLAAKIKALQQPLSQGLITGVGNNVQGQLAERGLGTSPQIAQEVYAQALAPYQMDEQRMAQEALFRALGLPLEAINVAQGTMQPPTDTSSFWQMLQKPNVPQLPGSSHPYIDPGIAPPDGSAGGLTPYSIQSIPGEDGGGFPGTEFF